MTTQAKNEAFIPTMLELVRPYQAFSAYSEAHIRSFRLNSYSVWCHCYLWQVYVKADSTYTGRVTVPVLWDQQTNQIVNNESRQIIQMFNSEFNTLGATGENFYPQSLKGNIDRVMDEIYQPINNGVYRNRRPLAESWRRNAVGKRDSQCYFPGNWECLPLASARCPRRLCNCVTRILWRSWEKLNPTANSELRQFKNSNF